MASVITTKHTLLQIEEGNAFALQPSRSQIFFALTANTPINVLVSDLADVDGKIPTYINFGGTGTFYVLWNASGASVPNATNLTGEMPEITPSFRKINGITSFSIVAAQTTSVEAALYVGT